MKESDNTHELMIELGRDLRTWIIHPPNTKKLYYIENRERLNGDTMSFWKHDNCGYTQNLNEAATFEENDPTLKDIIREQKLGIKKYRIWELDYLKKSLCYLLIQKQLI